MVECCLIGKEVSALRTYHWIRSSLVALGVLIGMTLAAASSPASSASAGLPFDDIASSFAKADIAALYERGIVGGTGPRTYEPAKSITRAEFAAMVLRLFGLEPVDASIPAFQDVGRKAWYYASVGAASQLGIVRGTSANSFGPGAAVTREQAAAILVRALRLKDKGAGDARSSFKDAAQIDDWAVEAVQIAANAGLIRGDNGLFRPHDPLTRAETAALLGRIAFRDEWEAQFEAAPSLGLQLGWQYGQTTSEYIASVSRSTVNTLVPRVFFLDSAKTLTDATDTALLKWASANGRKVWGMIGNRSNADTTHAMLSDASKRQTIVAALASLVQKYGMDGINVDFENVLPDDRSGMTSFVTELAAALHKVGAVVSVDVSPDQGDDWTAAFDYAALGRSADYLVLMAYDEHWETDPIAGSVSSLPWLEKGLDKLIGNVPAAKTIVALPFYTRQWTVSPKVSSLEMTIAEQAETISSLTSGTRSWNDTVGQYIYTFAKGATTYRIWAEDSRSLTLKSLAVAERGVAGLAYWSIGGETADVWPAIRNAAKYASFAFE